MELKKVVLITTGQPSTNPRIVKEANALHEAGFEVTVLYSHFIDWADKTDESLLQNKHWSYQMIGGSPSQNRRLFFFTKLRFKIYKTLNRFLGNRFLIAERAEARCYNELLTAAKNINAGWYIAHNLGALAVAVKAASHNNSKPGFDFEDYHRGEDNQRLHHDKMRIEFLEDKYVPRLLYISTASPMISAKVAEHFPASAGLINTLLNCFPLTQQPLFREKSPDDSSLHLFWFSQTIGTHRGLEILISALNKLNDPSIHLTLAGKCSNDFKTYLTGNANNILEQIHLAGIISPDEIPAFAANFDVGLALELTIPDNRNICLTNKVFTYLLAGNALILSDTAMQKAFNEQYKIGEVFPADNMDLLMEKILYYKKNRPVLDQQRTRNYELAKMEMNWEKESARLIWALNN